MKKVIENFVPQGGKHCITNALKQIFTYYGYPMSEEMLFGLASGLSFLYLNQSVSPMVNGRTKVFEFEQKLAGRLNISIRCRSSKNYEKVLETTRRMIDTDDPVFIYVDMPYLKYLGMDRNSHFGGHAVVLFGYDDAKKKFWVSDRDNHDYPIRVPDGEINQDYHLVDFDELEKARSSSHRPFPAKNKYLTFDFEGYKEVDKTVVQSAIKETCDTMLNAPAKLLGLNGIEKFSKEVLKWKYFSEEKLKTAGITNYFQINKDGGTGGGIFRKMYGQFLIEAAPIAGSTHLVTLGDQFIDVSNRWDEIADDMWKLSRTADTELLRKISGEVSAIYQMEKELYLSLDQCC